MTEPTDAELDAVLCNQWPAFSMQATLVRVWVRAAMRDALAKWGTTPAVVGEPVAWRVHPFDYGIGSQGVYAITSLPQQRDAWLRKGWKAEPLYTTPQPTQAQAGAVPQCWCLTCRPMRFDDPYSIRMALCPTCGNKRCPKANDHRNECTGSNEPGQPGSAYSGGIKGGQHGADN